MQLSMANETRKKSVWGYLILPVFKTLPQQKASCLQFLLLSFLKPCSDEIISGTNSSGFQAVNGAAWGRIFGKQDCNRGRQFTQGSADSCQAKLIFPKQLSLSQQQSTATQKRCPTDFFKWSADYWEQVNLIPLLLSLGGLWSPYLESCRWSFLEISFEKSWSSAQQDYWNQQIHSSDDFPQKDDKEIALHLQIRPPVRGLGELAQSSQAG